MGASAGTGVRGFAEGGSTSTPSGGFNGINPAAIKADSRAFGVGPAAQSLQRDLAREQTPQRQIYRPQYADYGLGATPQAQGYLRSALNLQPYGNQLPTFTRPQATPQQTYTRPVYSGVQSGIQSKVDPNLAIINQSFAPQPYQYDSDGNRHAPAPALMDQSQRDAILADPSKYLEYAQYVKGGGDPSQFAYKPPPISMMSQTQLEALRNKQKAELSRLLPPAYVPSGD